LRIGKKKEKRMSLTMNEECMNKLVIYKVKLLF
jgi:hypothetical protein